MGKVRISKEQADLIEQFKNNLKGFGREVLIECLDGHYEIKPEFKKDDWVYIRFKDTTKIAKILNSYHEVIQFYDNENLPNIKIDNQTRHATPTEIAEEKRRRFWHENGREVWELNKGDILDNGFGEDLTVVTINNTLSGRQVIFKCDSFDLMSSVKEHYSVACFAHDRKDLKK